ncbi:MAG: hypothetical protein OEV00_07930, partial [Acidobacteriota bacterium]|nr:hypothetical protein [Acidobacteriota bacterium]
AVTGGFGAAVLEECNRHGLSADRIHRCGLPDEFIYQGSRSEQLAEAGIDADGIAIGVRRLLDGRQKEQTSGSFAGLKRSLGFGAR